MKQVSPFMLVAAMHFVVAAEATTWANSEMKDPLTGKKVPSKHIMSYGGYIYNWPSKFDLVFWPLTDENWICLNPENGYAAFNDDFEELSSEEKKALRTWLAANYKPTEAPKSHEEKLDWLEKVYRQRTKDDAFWCSFYRLMAYVHREHREKSLEYVKKAIPLLEAQLKKNPKGTDRIEVLFCLGEYYRRTGETTKSRECFALLKLVQYTDEDGKKRTGHPYFISLVEEVEKLPAETPPGVQKKADDDRPQTPADW